MSAHCSGEGDARKLTDRDSIFAAILVDADLDRAEESDVGRTADRGGETCFDTFLEIGESITQGRVGNAKEKQADEAER
jgi:hypothetical protein